MKKAKKISIREYQSNIEVFVHEPEEVVGRALMIETTTDTIPSASYMPTIGTIQEKSGHVLTKKQAREVKDRIHSHCHWF